jgi:hypothetical protein
VVEVDLARLDRKSDSSVELGNKAKIPKNEAQTFDKILLFFSYASCRGLSILLDLRDSESYDHLPCLKIDEDRKGLRTRPRRR